MKNRGKTHDLYFLEKENEMNTELIFYDRVSKGPALEIKENHIYAKSKDLGKTKLIVKEVGGKVSEISDRSKRLICNMKGVLDKEDLWLVVEKAVELDDIYLDTWGGYNCVSLLVDSTEKLQKKIGDLDVFLPEEELTVNNQKLGVAFFKDVDANIIFEFITVRRS